MLNLDNVTLFCISSDNTDGAIAALQYSMRGINYGAVKLSSHIRSLTTYQRKLSSRNVMKLNQFTSTITIASITLPDTLIPTIVYWFSLMDLL